MTDVIAELRKEHGRMARLLDLLGREVAAFERSETPDYDLVEDILAYALNYPDLVHHPKEDAILARLAERAPDAAADIGDLEDEHRKLAAGTRRFAAAVENVLQDETLPRDWFISVANDYIGMMRRHMQMEEVVFFPAAKKHLTADDWAAVTAGLSTATDPLIDTEAENRFKRLHDGIMAVADDA